MSLLMKVSMSVTVFALSLVVLTIIPSLLATPVSAAPTPKIKISVNKSNLPASITIKVRLSQFKADAYLTDAVDILVRSPFAGGLSNQFITLTRMGTGSVTVMYPDYFTGGQYFLGFFGGTCKVDVYVYASWGMVHASITFKVD